MTMQRFSEPYQATGGLAAEGVINQLGRPDIEPLEVLVREAIQNCWDARRETRTAIRVEIGRATLDETSAKAIGERVLPDPPPGLPLTDELKPGARILYFSDFGTSGLGGPTRADLVNDGEVRDFVDFIRNIGQPPDKDLGGGSYGYGKAAFYIASRARTIIIDTLCQTNTGLERRVIGAALGANYTHGGRAYTGRHWWGEIIDGIPEPVTGDAAAEIAGLVGLPRREGRDGLGTTIAIIAPGAEPDGDADRVMPFIADALLWNFWPKMVSTTGGVQATIDFRLHDDGRRVPIPDPRIHERLHGFVDAIDRLRTDPDTNDPTVLDQRLASQRPIQDLGRLVIQKGPVALSPVDQEAAMPRGMRQMLGGVHHVALMRNAELVVKYHRGPEAATGRYGYSGVFRCSLATDQAFRDAEPPTHDEWVVRSMPKSWSRTYVSVAFQRIDAACREAAGLTGGARIASEGADIPLGEFADELARLMPGFTGPGARFARSASGARRQRRKAPGAAAAPNQTAEAAWVESTAGPATNAPDEGSPRYGEESQAAGPPVTAPDRSPPQPRPILRVGGTPFPMLRDDGTPVMRYPFDLRARGNHVILSASVRVMTNDGESVERDPPRGWIAPAVGAWIAPDGTEHVAATLRRDPAEADGSWFVEIPIAEEAILGVEILAEAC